MSRRTVVSRVIWVQRRYAVQIRPMESVAWAIFRQIFELFIEFNKICFLLFLLLLVCYTRLPIPWSDLNSISPLHPYYSRDCRSTSHFDRPILSSYFLKINDIVTK